MGIGKSDIKILYLLNHEERMKGKHEKDPERDAYIQYPVLAKQGDNYYIMFI